MSVSFNQILYNTVNYIEILYNTVTNMDGFIFVLEKSKKKIRTMFTSSHSGKAVGFPCRGRGEQHYVDNQV